MRRLKILHDAGGSIIRYRRAARIRSRVLVVTFTGFEGARNRRPGFAETALVEAGYDCIAVKMANCNNYNDISFETMRKAVRRRARRYERVVTYGASGGGYAALYYSEAVGASLNLAISPRNTRDPRYARLGELAMHRRQFAHARLTELPTKRALSLVVFDPKEALDLLYYRREVEPMGRCVAVPFPYSHHPTTRVLGELGALKTLLLGVLEGVDVPDAAAEHVASTVREARRRRGQSPYFVANLMVRAALRTGKGLFDRLEGRVDIAALTVRAAIRMRYAYRMAGREMEYRKRVEAHLAAHPDAVVVRRAVAYDAVNQRSRLATMADRFALRRLGDHAHYLQRVPARLEPAAMALSIGASLVIAAFERLFGVGAIGPDEEERAAATPEGRADKATAKGARAIDRENRRAARAERKSRRADERLRAIKPGGSGRRRRR
ncbi:MAG TPA: hypothetical protein VMP03_09620 [Methylomirabilota bacterium]|nr:hypothetical protein [Methylomirabilota bacterium]